MDEKPIQIVFGENLRKNILGKGISLNQFAKNNNIDRRKLGRWTSGETLPSPEDIERLAKILGLTEAQLFER